MEGRYALIVEDSALTRVLLAEIIARLGFETDVVASGSEALQTLGEADFDLAVVDLNLGDGIPGTVVIEEIVRRCPWTAIVVLTAYRTPRLIGDLRVDDSRFAYLAKEELDSIERLSHAIDCAISGHGAAVRPGRRADFVVTPQQADILRMVAEGHTNSQIAETLGVTLKAVEHAIRRLYRSLQLDEDDANSSRRVLAARAFDRGNIAVSARPSRMQK